MKNKVKLIMQENEHNKFYELEQVTASSFKASWGRIGTNAQFQYYPIEFWDKKLKEKLNKGYKDVSESKLSIEDIFKELDKLALKFS